MNTSGWTKATWAGWSLMTLMAVGTAGYGAFAVFASLAGQLPSMTHHFPDRAAAAAIHFGVGGLVLLIGPFQFLRSIRTKWPALHRWTGRIYVTGCLASGIAALILASDFTAGVIAQTGFSLLALFWIAATSMAFVRLRQRNFAEHRIWMIRSYALTLAAVALRVYLPVSLFALEIPFAIAYPAISFACWVPNALVAEWLVRK